MIVNSGASDHLVDDELIPRLRDSMSDYKELEEPKIIFTAGNKEAFATAPGTIWGYIIDQAGQRVPVGISAMIVSGLACNLFSSFKAMNSGVSTILKTGNLYIRFNRDTSLPLNQHPEDNGLCSYKVFLRALGGYINNTPGEASQEGGASPPGLESIAGSSGVVPATSGAEPTVQL